MYVCMYEIQAKNIVNCNYYICTDFTLGKHRASVARESTLRSGRKRKGNARGEDKQP